MGDLAATTVHRFLGSGDRAAERLDDRLVPQADAQDRFAGLEFFNRLQADASLVRIAGARGKHDGGGVELLDLFRWKSNRCEPRSCHNPAAGSTERGCGRRSRSCR